MMAKLNRITVALDDADYEAIKRWRGDNKTLPMSVAIRSLALTNPLIEQLRAETRAEFDLLPGAVERKNRQWPSA